MNDLALATKSLVPAAGEAMVLGEVSPSLGATIAALDEAVKARARHVSNLAQQIVEHQRRDFMAKHGLGLTHAQYLEAVPKRVQMRKAYERDGFSPEIKLAHLPLMYRHREEFTPDTEGWIRYLVAQHEGYGSVLGMVPAPALPEALRKQHTLISAASGWGKSELMKALVHHYVTHPSSAVIVLDPHGDMARQIARFPEFEDGKRLVFVEPGLRPGLTVGLNPLDGRGLDEEGVALSAAQIATALGELVADLTPNMQTVARNCVRVLLEEKTANLFDLVQLLAPRAKRGSNQPENPRRAAIIAKGKRHPDRTVAEFFAVDMDGESFDSAKAALRNRVLSLLSIPSFQAMTCGPATVDLERAMDARKIVVVNLGPLGSEGGSAMGRLLINMVAAIGRRRERQPLTSRIPCHVLVDEASTMISPAMLRILTELRKYGIHLTLAQQVGGTGFADDGRRILATNTACKFVGSNDGGEIGRLFGKDARDLPKLQRGQFWVKWGADADPVKLTVRSDLADDRHSLSGAAWEAAVDRMTSDYYRPAKQALETTQEAAEAVWSTPLE